MITTDVVEGNVGPARRRRSQGAVISPAEDDCTKEAYSW